ncbi:MAG TPA: hypothetical protein VK164_01605 [Flavobacterium sp.]|uniref:hypothetical protein n=1 Tax=Flavobacterium sp. TaxID=239 RepID=UPI002B4B13AD|nr:hypothetical protein [Flavobacterium sp.]HLO72609.1 hypothetical protein [Flavobacterium sp.]
MKKKLLYINVLLMLSVIFTVGYQSIHAFSHEHHHTVECIAKQQSTTDKSTTFKTFTEKENCPICDFKWKAFLSPERFQYTLFVPSESIPYLDIISKNGKNTEVSLFYLRGPPVFNI